MEPAEAWLPSTQLPAFYLFKKKNKVWQVNMRCHAHTCSQQNAVRERLCVHALGSETVTDTSAGRWERKMSAQQSI